MIKLPKAKETKFVYHGGNGAFDCGYESGWNACLAEVQRLNATAQPVSDGWVNCSERMPPVKTAIIVGKWNGRLWATKWATYIPSHPDANSFGYIMPGGSWEPDFWMIAPAAPGGQ